MSKVKGPLMSIDASGSIGDAFFFSKWKRRNKVSKHFVPKNPQTAFQQLNREFIAEGINAWRQLSASQKQAYDELIQSKNLSMSGYNYYLSQYVVTQRNYIHEPIMNGMVQWNKFDEDSGLTAYDTSDNNRTWSLNNGADWQPGIINNCVQTYGTDTFADNSHAYNLNSLGTWTFMFWIYINLPAPGSSEPFGDNIDSIYMRRGSAGNADFVRRKSDHGNQYSAQVTIPNKEWHNIAILTDGTRWKGYFDGVEFFDYPLTGGQFDGGETFFIGRAEPPPASGWPVKVDDFIFYDRALSPDEIRHNINRKIFF